MTDLRSQAQILLQEAEYDTWLTAVNNFTLIGFENDTVMGFVSIFDGVDSLLERWQSTESAALLMHAPSLQKAGEKTWNVYSVFLTSVSGSDVQERKVRWIEEDLERTRKIAACGVNDRSSLITALLPLLPLQYQPTLDSEQFDVTQRLGKRVSDIAPAASTAVLDEKVSPTEVVRLLASKS